MKEKKRMFHNKVYGKTIGYNWINIIFLLTATVGAIYLANDIATIPSIYSDTSLDLEIFLTTFVTFFVPAFFLSVFFNLLLGIYGEMIRMNYYNETMLKKKRMLKNKMTTISR